MDFLAGRPGEDGLREENQRLRARLQTAEACCRRAQQRSKALEHRLQQVEAAAGQRLAHLLRQKEDEWVLEADRNVRALLEIIRHHEDTHARLQKDVESLKAEKDQLQARLPAVGMAACATQTESASRPAYRCINDHHFGPYEAHKEDQRRQEALVEREAHAYMQQLFEQLQVSSAVREGKRLPPTRPAGSVASSALSRMPQGRALRFSSAPGRDFKTSVIQRLDASYAGPITPRCHRPPSIPEEDEQAIDKEDGQMPVQAANAAVQDLAAASGASLLQQGLEERNRLLQERLASQQKVLDQLLQSRLEQATHAANPISPVPSRDSTETSPQHGGTPTFTEKSDLEPSTVSHDVAATLKGSALLSMGAIAQGAPSRRAQPRPLSPPAA